jgi:hypothetical protein
MLATSASGFDWAESDLIGGDMDDISEALNDVSVAVGSKSNSDELLGVVDDTVSVVLIPTWFTLLLLFDG